ncbi:MAG: hypothetical protein Tsb009_22830 [Planctomycetaceae bacterium]
MPYPLFDLARLKFSNEENSKPAMTVERLHSLESDPAERSSVVESLGQELVKARNQGGATIFLCDADVLRAGVSRQLIDLIEKGLLTHLSIEPAGVLCDWELASQGLISANADQQLARTEMIQRLLNTLAEGDAQEFGVGEALGRRIGEEEYPHAKLSVLAQAERWGVPVTVHAAIGGALLHAANGFDPAVVGRMLHRDFLILANSVENLDDGVVYQFGLPVCAVEVFRNALAISRNVAGQYQRPIKDFTTAVFTDSLQTGGTILAEANADRHQNVELSSASSLIGLRRAALNFAGWQTAAET